MIGTATLTHRPADLIDALLTRTQGECLKTMPLNARGEYDYLRGGHVSVKDVQRLRAAGLISSHGIEADRLAMVYGWEGDCSAFVEYWVETGLAGLRARRDIRAGIGDQIEPDPDDDETPAPHPAADNGPSELPEPLAAYLSRLLSERKRQHAAAVILALVEGSPLPTVDAPWADNVTRRCRRFLNCKPTTRKAQP